ncbi:MAG TPA: methyltransferase domain-containing protein [Acetobacteraceae bacterium]|nr:methyltransferase domain-containing protein [Acetobacteraceae bacterium]
MLNDLQKAKAAFRGDSERDQAIEAIALHHERCVPNLLDIGAGDSTFALALLSRLKYGQNGRLVAIDPTFQQPIAQPDQSIKFLRIRIEDYEADQEFSCINIRQCAYYFDDPIGSVDRIVRWLRPSGLLAVTLWTPDCIFYRLQAAILRALGKVAPIIDAESVCAGPAASGAIELAFAAIVPGRLDASAVMNNPEITDAIFKLAARKLDISGFPAKDREEIVRTSLGAMTGPVYRVNEIRLYRRRPT